jgi:hypothetical protein
MPESPWSQGWEDWWSAGRGWFVRALSMAAIGAGIGWRWGPLMLAHLQPWAAGLVVGAGTALLWGVLTLVVSFLKAPAKIIAERDAVIEVEKATIQGMRTPPKVEISEAPRVEPVGDRRRMVTFPRVTVENVGLGQQRVCLRLQLNGWDAAYIPPYKPPEIFTRGGPARLPEEIDLRPGEQAVGQIQFRIPFAEPSERSALFRLVVARPSMEVVVSEFSVPIASMPSPLPTDPPSPKASG